MKYQDIVSNSSLFYTYRQYIQKEKLTRRRSLHYNNWRERVLKRDNYSCQECGSIENLNVHHKKQYIDNIFLRDKANNGITLCKQCHDLAHPWNKKQIKTIIRKASNLSEAQALAR